MCNCTFTSCPALDAMRMIEEDNTITKRVRKHLRRLRGWMDDGGMMPCGLPSETPHEPRPALQPCDHARSGGW